MRRSKSALGRVQQNERLLRVLGQVDGLLDVIGRPGEGDRVAAAALIVRHRDEVAHQKARARAWHPRANEYRSGLLVVPGEQVPLQRAVHLLRQTQGASGHHSPNSRASECSTRLKCVPTLSLFGSQVWGALRWRDHPWKATPPMVTLTCVFGIATPRAFRPLAPW